MKKLFIAGPVVRDTLPEPARIWLQPIYEQLSGMSAYSQFPRSLPDVQAIFPESDIHLEQASPQQFRDVMFERMRHADGILVVLPYESTSIGIEAGMAIDLQIRLGVVAKEKRLIPKILDRYWAIVGTVRQDQLISLVRELVSR